MAVTPAGAEVSNAVATNWKKIWKKNLKPLADKRYYTKAQSDAKYSTKAETAAGDAASNAATDTKLGGYYKKAEIDAKLAPLVNSVASNSGGDQLVTLTGAIQTIRSVSLMPPSNGTVIVTSSAYIINNGAGVSSARCSITPGANLEDPFFQRATITNPGDTDVIAGTRGFAVTKGTLLTVNLVCDSISGTSDLRDSNLSAMFAPN